MKNSDNINILIESIIKTTIEEIKDKYEIQDLSLLKEEGSNDIVTAALEKMTDWADTIGETILSILEFFIPGVKNNISFSSLGLAAAGTAEIMQLGEVLVSVFNMFDKFIGGKAGSGGVLSDTAGRAWDVGQGLLYMFAGACFIVEGASGKIIDEKDLQYKIIGVILGVVGFIVVVSGITGNKKAEKAIEAANNAPIIIGGSRSIAEVLNSSSTILKQSNDVFASSYPNIKFGVDSWDPNTRTAKGAFTDNANQQSVPFELKVGDNGNVEVKADFVEGLNPNIKADIINDIELNYESWVAEQKKIFQDADDVELSALSEFSTSPINSLFKQFERLSKGDIPVEEINKIREQILTRVKDSGTSSGSNTGTFKLTQRGEQIYKMLNLPGVSEVQFASGMDRFVDAQQLNRFRTSLDEATDSATTAMNRPVSDTDTILWSEGEFWNNTKFEESLESKWFNDSPAMKKLISPLALLMAWRNKNIGAVGKYVDNATYTVTRRKKISFQNAGYRSSKTLTKRLVAFPLKIELNYKFTGAIDPQNNQGLMVVIDTVGPKGEMVGKIKLKNPEHLLKKISNIDSKISGYKNYFMNQTAQNAKVPQGLPLSLKRGNAGAFQFGGNISSIDLNPEGKWKVTLKDKPDDLSDNDWGLITQTATELESQMNIMEEQLVKLEKNYIIGTMGVDFSVDGRTHSQVTQDWYFEARKALSKENPRFRKDQQIMDAEIDDQLAKDLDPGDVRLGEPLPGAGFSEKALSKADDLPIPGKGRVPDLEGKTIKGIVAADTFVFGLGYSARRAISSIIGTDESKDTVFLPEDIDNVTTFKGKSGINGATLLPFESESDFFDAIKASDPGIDADLDSLLDDEDKK